MAARIRLTRKGTKKKPFYRIVVADSEAPRDGKFLEILGTYNPLTDPAEVKIDPERLRVWLDRGAQPSDTVRSLIKQKGLLAGSA
ncbi:MAG: 30S ribosomal protein S16 [Deltaproteobacteria bacterium]|jgi:small subunit ribosomal protein S16|nr:30S ribosomal protein S16 [Deltaproteobacteria bacterium]MBW2625274.1 30S ribosomal protein S16 [Deltaproteobacteria bacterium]